MYCAGYNNFSLIYSLLAFSWGSSYFLYKVSQTNALLMTNFAAYEKFPDRVRSLWKLCRQCSIYWPAVIYVFAVEQIQSSIKPKSENNRWTRIQPIWLMEYVSFQWRADIWLVMEYFGWTCGVIWFSNEVFFHSFYRAVCASVYVGFEVNGNVVLLFFLILLEILVRTWKSLLDLRLLIHVVISWVCHVKLAGVICLVKWWIPWTNLSWSQWRREEDYWVMHRLN